MSPNPGDQAARLERALTAFREAAQRRMQARHGGPRPPDISVPGVNSVSAVPQARVSSFEFIWRLFSIGRPPPPEA